MASPTHCGASGSSMVKKLSNTGHIAIGASAMRWDGEALAITIDETTVPLPSRLRGRVVVRPRAVADQTFALDAAGRHRWRPIGPLSDVSAEFESPNLSWRGTGYFDTNDCDEPLEAAFRSWTWTRFDMGTHARIFYDVVERDGTTRDLSLDVRDGLVTRRPPTPYGSVPTTRWGVTRAVPCDPGDQPTLVGTMESAPFYARSAIRSRIDGVEADGVHENLLLDRLVSPPVRLMVPFKMGRRA